jgi:hypothetical protein
VEEIRESWGLGAGPETNLPEEISELGEAIVSGARKGSL